MNPKAHALLALALLTLAGCGGNNRNAANDESGVSPSGRNAAPYTAQSVQPAADKPTPLLKAGQEKAVRQPQPLSLADLHHKYRSTFLFSGPSSVRKAALTFDDVPDAKFTPQVLDVLKKFGVKATFFVVGNRAEAHPDIVKRIVSEGHAIGNHSYSHPNLPKASDNVFHEEIERTEGIIAELAGRSSKLFRPPYGNIDEKQIQWLAGRQFHIINWNVDSLDWKGLDAEQVSANVLTHVMPGSIILQHGAGGTGEDLTGTVQALPVIIDRLQSRGIELVTVPQLLGLP